MIMNKHYLSIEQMKNLQALGLDCSKASHVYLDKDIIPMSMLSSEDIGRVDICPVFDLQDILEALPETVMAKGYLYTLKLTTLVGGGVYRT